MNPVKISNNLKKEADKVLKDTKVIEILSRYGKVVLTGSYSYNLLTWRDIDICLVSLKQPTPKFMFKIGSDLSKIKDVASMYYRNELILKTKGNPKGIFWCTEMLHNKQMWKIDILVSTKKIIAKVIRLGLDIKAVLTPRKRHSILEIKHILSQDKNYRKEFRSTDIYEAVLD